MASIAQRLLRKLCNECKRECPPNTNLIEAVFDGREIPAAIDLVGPYYEAVGCDRCGQTGYIGRTPIYEIMAVTPALEKAIESGLPASKLRELACSEGMNELAIGGLEQARRGVTSIEEVYFKISG